MSQHDANMWCASMCVAKYATRIDGTTHRQKRASKDVRSYRIGVETPRCRDGEKEAGVFSSWLLQWAAVATTNLLKTKNPALYNSMEMNATTHRFPAKCGSIWTSVRLAWMRKGTRCPNHRDHHNMPGTVATSVTINLGGVAGGELCLYNDKGEVIAIAEADDCIHAGRFPPPA